VSQKWQKFSPEFRREAVARMKECDNVAALARELGVGRKWLYKWKQDLARDPTLYEKLQPGVKPKRKISLAEEKLRKQVQRLELLVARQSQEIDFFKSALQNIEKRRRKCDETSGSASTNKSGE
jgi:transposase-like protein